MEFWHNPRCSKSRQTLALLQEKAVDVQVVEYLKSPPTQKRLREVAKKMGVSPRDMMRKNEALYKELNLVEASDTLLIKAMAEHPILIERPIVIDEDRAIIGRPPENVLQLL
ncbi:MAG: arsenate reductase (glutaredoxin) [Aquisalinus sp.]|nr:arsenate reductase (glutaredoxin) [Aquisalinus sp.]